MKNNAPSAMAVSSPVTHIPAVAATHTPKMQSTVNQSAAAVNHDQVRFIRSKP